MFCLQQVTEVDIVEKEEQGCRGEPAAVQDGGKDVRLDLSSIVQKLQMDASPSTVGNDMRLDLPSIGQMLPKHPVPLVSNLSSLPWQTCVGGPMQGSTLHLHNRMHFPLTKYRNQAFLDAQQWAVAFAVFASSNPSQVE